MTGAHEPPPVLAAHVQAAALRSEFPEYTVDVVNGGATGRASKSLVGAAVILIA